MTCDCICYFDCIMLSLIFVIRFYVSNSYCNIRMRMGDIFSL